MVKDQPLHILHLVEYLHLGGIERLLQQIAEHTDPSRHRLSFFTYRSPQLTGIGAAIASSDQNWPVYTHDTKKFDFKLLWQLRRLIKREKIEVIHTHDLGPMLYAAMLKILCPGLRLVHTHHTIGSVTSSPKLAYYFGICSLFYTELAAVAQGVADKLRQTCPFFTRSCVVLPNGVDIQRFASIDTDFGQRPWRLLTLSRICPDKNLKQMIQACRILRDQGIAFEWRHAGARDQAAGQKGVEHEQELLRAVKEHQLEDAVTFVGYCSDIKPLMEWAQIFVSTSRTEGHPVSLLEAMSAGKFCILSPIVGHQFAMAHGAQATILDDPAHLAQTIASLATRPESLAPAARRGRALAKQRFSFDRFLDQYDYIYRRPRGFFGLAKTKRVLND